MFHQNASQMKTKNIAVSIAILMLVALTSCFKQRHVIKKINPEFAKYVSGFTSGSIGRRQSIRIELADQYDNPGGKDSTKSLYDLPDAKVLEGIFNFEPNIQGKAVWVNRRVIEFIPEKPMPVNQIYDVTFNLKKVAIVNRGFETFEFQFNSFPQTMSVQIDGLKTYSTFNSTHMKLVGSISTGDFEDTSRIKDVITAEYMGRQLKFKWNFSTYENRYYFYIDSIAKQTVRQDLTIAWNGKNIQANAFGENKLEVPALGDFSVSEVNIVDEDEQKVELYFSEMIQMRQNLKGIVQVSGVEDFTYSIEGNVVRLFFDNRISGIKEILVGTGIRNAMGHTMSEPYAVTLEFFKAKPKVRLFGSGSILPNSQGLIFPFETVSLKKVDVKVSKILETNVHQFLQVNNLDGRDELSRVSKKIAETTIALDTDKKKDLSKWNSYVIDLSKIMTPEPGAIYRVSIRFKKAYALCDCEEVEQAEADDKPQEPVMENEEQVVYWNEDGWNSWGYDDGYDTWYDYYGSNESPCNNEYYHGKGVSRNIIASDIGMIYKLDEDKLSHAFISNMVSTQPIAGCKVEYFDYSKNLIAGGITDEVGMLDVKLKAKPFLMIASYGKQKGYLKLQDAYANSMSKFEVDGEVIQKGIKGFFYGERGVWRPGDSIYLNFILEDKFSHLPGNYPVKFELRDPDGAIVSQYTDLHPVRGFYSFKTVTAEEAVTGNYNVVAKVGNQNFFKTIMVETIKPNRLKIQLDLPDELKSVAMGDTIGKLQVKWLHGADAPNLNTKVEVSFSSIKTEFKSYKDFIFDSPLRQYPYSSMMVYDSKLDDKGNAFIRKTFDESGRSAGFLRANFITRVFEAGGDFSTDRFSTLYSPFKEYVGMHLKSEGGWISAKQNYPLELVAVDESGKAVNSGKVSLKIYKLEWRWWYEEDAEDLADFVSRSSAIVLNDTTIQMGSKGFKYNLYFAAEEYGKYLAVATDLNSGHQTGEVFYVDYGDWRRDNGKDKENAKMLSFSLDKQTYKPGENMQLTLPSKAGGKALISIENSRKVLEKFWISTTENETRCLIKVNESMTPNVYVHVTLLQQHAQTKNDLPIRMYGVLPVTVDVPETHIEPVLACADNWLPESTAKVSVRENTGKGMVYTLAVVDDGLLDLTRFKTPQPWKVFYAKEALGVKTWDLYDQVIGAYSGKLDKLISIGGDGSGLNPEGAKANRFKPMVRYIGPYYLAAGKTATHRIPVPNYVGSVRVMVVAGNNKGAYGNAEKTVSVKKPLMVLATLPRVLGPGETLQLPVDVFAMEDHVRKVKIKVETSDLLQIDGAAENTISFTGNGDEVVNFKMKVSKAIGVASVRITAECGKEKAVQTIEVDVRASNPKVADTRQMVVSAGKSFETSPSFKGLEGSNRLVLEVSRIPSVNMDNRLNYLIQYPHGCIEQTTSSVFPQLFVQSLLDIDKERQKIIEKNVKAGLYRLQFFQTASGGFAYWPGESYESEWGSNYAGHFILEAEKMGYVVPANLKNRWLKYQSNQAKSWNPGENPFDHSRSESSYQLVQSYRLYTLALAGKPELGAMNNLRSQLNLMEATKWQLAAAYELVGQHEVAVRLVKDLKLDIQKYREYSYSYGSDFRDYALILEAMSLMGMYEKATDLAEKVANEMGSENWMSTQETAYGLLSLCRFANLNSNTAEMSFKYQMAGKEMARSSRKKIVILAFSEKEVDVKTKLNFINTGKGNLYVKVINEGIPMIGDQSNAENHLKLSIEYKDLNGHVIDVTKLAQGTDFFAEVSIENNGKRGNLRELALTQIFPSGWEIRNDRFLGEASSDAVRYKDYRDDRVYCYYNLSQGGKITVKVRLNATFQGRFYLPTIYTEAMYDRTVNARLAGRWVEVVPYNPNVTVK